MKRCVEQLKSCPKWVGYHGAAWKFRPKVGVGFTLGLRTVQIHLFKLFCMHQNGALGVYPKYYDPAPIFLNCAPSPKCLGSCHFSAPALPWKLLSKSAIFFRQAMHAYQTRLYIIVIWPLSFFCYIYFSILYLQALFKSHIKFGELVSNSNTFFVSAKYLPMHF